MEKQTNKNEKTKKKRLVFAWMDSPGTKKKKKKKMDSE